MKTLLVGLVVFAVGLIVGQQFLGHGSEDGKAMAASGAEEPLYWVAPMDKNYRRDGPGKSPMGMDLVPVYDEAGTGDDANSVKISAVVENNLGVKVAPVTREKLVTPVDTVGTVELDESAITHVHSRVEGWIERLGVAASGDPVSRGQTLFELYSPALVSAQEEYLAALRSGNDNLIRASRSRLSALGLTASQVEALNKRRKVEQTISFVADRDGIVIDLNVRQGMFIKPATEVMSFGSLDSVWVLGEVFERQAHLVETGQPAEARLSTMPGRTWQGSIDYIYPELDPKTRTLTVRINLPNEDHSLKPNMLMDLSVRGEAAEETTSIPRHALIKAGNHNRVVKSLGDGRYQSVLVKAGLEGERRSEVQDMLSTESRVQILQGLQEGDLVVTSAQFLIDSESNVDADLLRMEEPGSQMSNAAMDPRKTYEIPEKMVNTSGEIKMLMLDINMLEVVHKPIPEWEWPAMRMTFVVPEGENLPNLSEGDEVDFALRELDSGDYEMSKITVKKP